MVNRISLLILSLVLLVFSTSASADPWPIKKFDVIAVAAADEWPDWTLERVSRDVQRLVQETGIIDPYFPTLFQTIPIDPEVQAVIETYLYDVANQFEQWAFRAPALQPQVENAAGKPAYRVFLISNLGNNAGEYHAYCFDTVNRILLLSRDSILNPNGTIKSRGNQTIAHELFHAVQYSYPFVECPRRSESVGNWIVEGSAGVDRMGLVNLFQVHF